MTEQWTSSVALLQKLLNDVGARVCLCFECKHQATYGICLSCLCLNYHHYRKMLPPARCLVCTGPLSQLHNHHDSVGKLVCCTCYLKQRGTPPIELIFPINSIRSVLFDEALRRMDRIFQPEFRSFFEESGDE